MSRPRAQPRRVFRTSEEANAAQIDLIVRGIRESLDTLMEGPVPLAEIAIPPNIRRLAFLQRILHGLVKDEGFGFGLFAFVPTEALVELVKSKQPTLTAGLPISLVFDDEKIPRELNEGTLQDVACYVHGVFHSLIHTIAEHGAIVPVEREAEGADAPSAPPGHLH